MTEPEGHRKQTRPRNRHTQQPPGIAEKVRFWEEQDRINQVLISRVIGQNELLTKHIEEHDDLPELFRRQLRDALEEQSRRARPLRWLVIGAFVVSLTAMIVSLWA